MADTGGAEGPIPYELPGGAGLALLVPRGQAREAALRLKARRDKVAAELREAGERYGSLNDKAPAAVRDKAWERYLAAIDQAVAHNRARDRLLEAFAAAPAPDGAAGPS